MASTSYCEQLTPQDNEGREVKGEREVDDETIDDRDGQIHMCTDCGVCSTEYFLRGLIERDGGDNDRNGVQKTQSYSTTNNHSLGLSLTNLSSR